MHTQLFKKMAALLFSQNNSSYEVSLLPLYLCYNHSNVFIKHYSHSGVIEFIVHGVVQTWGNKYNNPVITLGMQNVYNSVFFLTLNSILYCKGAFLNPSH